MRIALDIDDTLADYNQTFSAFLLHEYDITITRQGWTTMKFHDLLGRPKEECIAMINHFHESSYFTTMQPIAGAAEGVAALRKEHEIILVTARHDGMDAVTRTFITENFGNVFASLHYTNYARHNGTEVSKAEICLREGAELMIDDNLEHIASCAAVNIPSLLIDAPWNQKAELPEIATRVYSWHEIVERLVPNQA